MKIQKRPSSKIIIASIAGVVLLGAMTICGYIYFSRSNGPDMTKGINQVDYSSPTDAQKDAGDKIKSQSIDDDSGKPTTPDTDTTPVTNTNRQYIDITITNVSQHDSTLSIRSLIGSIMSQGTCTLTIKKNGAVVTKSSDIQALASSSTCKGFDIPISELSAGQWNVQLDVSSSDGAGSVSKSITIQ